MSAGYRLVQWNAFKVRYDLVVVGCIAAFVGVFVVLSLAIRPAPRDLSPPIVLIRAFGACAYVMLHAVLCIGPLARLDRRFLPLLYNRRHLGVATFFVALTHAVLAVGFYHGFSDTPVLVSLLTSNTEYRSVSAFPFEVLGLLALLILFLMAATSHDLWLKKLSQPVWKSLHMGVYVAWAAAVMHVALGALQSERSMVFSALAVIGVVVVGSLHLMAGRREVVRDRHATVAGDWIDAGPIDGIEEGRAAVVSAAGGERVAVFRHGGRLSAISNVCAHQGGPLGEGRIVNGCVTCPWHGYQYRPSDGRSPPPLRTASVHIDYGSATGASCWTRKCFRRALPLSHCRLGKRRLYMRDRSTFFIGYRETPPSLTRPLRATVLGAVFTVGALSALLAIAQRDPGTGRWDNSPVTLEGTLVASPYPMLNTGSPVLLVGQGKRGLGGRRAGMQERVVRVRGLTLERDGLRLVEVMDDEDAITVVDASAPAPSKHAEGSPVRLSGEVIDPKCLCGAMKPGDGKTHKACAALCLRGGVPPVLAARDAAGTVRYYVLTDAAGGGFAGDDLARVSRFAGDRVEVTGVAEERDGLQTLRVHASDLRRL